MRSAYTKGEREYLEAMVIKNKPDILLAEIEEDEPESKLLSRCTEFLRKNNYKYFHDYSKKKNEAGILDLYIFLPKKRLVVMELKKPKTGRLSDKQKEWVSYLLYHGYEVYPDVRSYKKFIEVIYGR